MRTPRKAKVSTRSPRGMVSLVSMPFEDLRHPPILVGILQRCLERHGIKARSHSPESAFIEHLHKQTADDAQQKTLTISDYQDIATRDFVVNLGDWVFEPKTHSRGLGPSGSNCIPASGARAG